MSYYTTATRREVHEDTPRDPKNGICSLRGMDIDWDAIERENARYARELREKQKDYPAAFFDATMPSVKFNPELKPSKPRPAPKPAPLEPIACAFCGATFMPKSRRQRFCSVLCKSREYWGRRAAQKREQKLAPELGDTFTLVKPVYDRACKHCGEMFTPTHHRQRFCSLACSSQGHLAHNRAYRAAARKVYNNVCACCGKTWTSNRKARACSDACRSKLSYKYVKKGTRRGRKPSERSAE